MENPSILSHISLGTNHFEKAIEFYDAVLATVGAKRTMELLQYKAVAYGKQFPEFWVQSPIDGNKAETANGTHFSFLAPNNQAVDSFYEAALSNGATCDGKPGVRPEYGKEYYGCFVRDLDGHKIEAMCWNA